MPTWQGVFRASPVDHRGHGVKAHLPPEKDITSLLQGDISEFMENGAESKFMLARNNVEIYACKKFMENVPD